MCSFGSIGTRHSGGEAERRHIQKQQIMIRMIRILSVLKPRLGRTSSLVESGRHCVCQEVIDYKSMLKTRLRHRRSDYLMNDGRLRLSAAVE